MKLELLLLMDEQILQGRFQEKISTLSLEEIKELLNEIGSNRFQI